MTDKNETGPGERERELEERNQRLASTLREARDQMVDLRDLALDEERARAIGNALDYAAIAIDMRIAELKAAIARGVVGQGADCARRLDAFTIGRIFEDALRASGYEIVKRSEDGAE